MVLLEIPTADVDAIRRIVTDMMNCMDAEDSLEIDPLCLTVDLTACHAGGCPLDLAKLEAADLLTRTHDVFGIRDNLNQETGELENGFLPLCAKHSQEVKAPDGKLFVSFGDDHRHTVNGQFVGSRRRIALVNNREHAHELFGGKFCAIYAELPRSMQDCLVVDCTKPPPALTETRSLLLHMRKAGFDAYKVDDYDDYDPLTVSDKIDDLAIAASAVDECDVFFRHGDTKTKVARVFLVYGNGPYLVNDWAFFKACDDKSVRDAFDAALFDWSSKMEARGRA